MVPHKTNVKIFADAHPNPIEQRDRQTDRSEDMSAPRVIGFANAHAMIYASQARTQDQDTPLTLQWSVSGEPVRTAPS
ncbi:hypothetical protein J6590_012834 [Homalodisca vitripennis]|nr:hypothetical protein J6590_012834 [Homalodisca vitripennis]